MNFLPGLNNYSISDRICSQFQIRTDDLCWAAELRKERRIRERNNETSCEIKPADFLQTECETSK